MYNHFSVVQWSKCCDANLPVVCSNPTRAYVCGICFPSKSPSRPYMSQSEPDYQHWTTEINLTELIRRVIDWERANNIVRKRSSCVNVVILISYFLYVYL